MIQTNVVTNKFTPVDQHIFRDVQQIVTVPNFVNRPVHRVQTVERVENVYAPMKPRQVNIRRIQRFFAGISWPPRIERQLYMFLAGGAELDTEFAKCYADAQVQRKTDLLFETDVADPAVEQDGSVEVSQEPQDEHDDQAEEEDQMDGEEQAAQVHDMHVASLRARKSLGTTDLLIAEGKGGWPIPAPPAGPVRWRGSASVTIGGLTGRRRMTFPSGPPRPPKGPLPVLTASTVWNTAVPKPVVTASTSVETIQPTAGARAVHARVIACVKAGMERLMRKCSSPSYFTCLKENPATTFLQLDESETPAGSDDDSTAGQYDEDYDSDFLSHDADRNLGLLQTGEGEEDAEQGSEEGANTEGAPEDIRHLLNSLVEEQAEDAEDDGDSDDEDQDEDKDGDHAAAQTAISLDGAPQTAAAELDEGMSDAESAKSEGASGEEVDESEGLDSEGAANDLLIGGGDYEDSEDDGSEYDGSEYEGSDVLVGSWKGVPVFPAGSVPVQVVVQQGPTTVQGAAVYRTNHRVNEVFVPRVIRHDRVHRVTVGQTVYRDTPVTETRYVTRRNLIERPAPAPVFEDQVVTNRAPTPNLKDLMSRGLLDARHVLSCQKFKCANANKKSPVKGGRGGKWTPPGFKKAKKAKEPVGLTLGELRAHVRDRVRQKMRQWITYFQRHFLDKGAFVRTSSGLPVPLANSGLGSVSGIQFFPKESDAGYSVADSKPPQ